MLMDICYTTGQKVWGKGIGKRIVMRWRKRRVKEQLRKTIWECSKNKTMIPFHSYVKVFHHHHLRLTPMIQNYCNTDGYTIPSTIPTCLSNLPLSLLHVHIIQPVPTSIFIFQPTETLDQGFLNSLTFSSSKTFMSHWCATLFHLALSHVFLQFSPFPKVY